MDDQSHSAAKTINAGKARVNFGQMLDEVYYKGDQFIIERAGKPMAAVVPLWQLEELQKHCGPAKTGHDTIKERKRYTKKRRA
jgi:prevent-host-death family protein